MSFSLAAWPTAGCEDSSVILLAKKHSVSQYEFESHLCFDSVFCNRTISAKEQQALVCVTSLLIFNYLFILFICTFQEAVKLITKTHQGHDLSTTGNREEACPTIHSENRQVHFHYTYTIMYIFFQSPSSITHLETSNSNILPEDVTPPPFTHNSQLILFRSIVYLGEIWAGCQCFVIYSMSTLGNSERIRADGKKIKGKEISVFSFSFFLYYSSSSGQS